MFRLPKRDNKKSLSEPVESLPQKPGKCNLFSNFLPQIGLCRARKRACRRGANLEKAKNLTSVQFLEVKILYKARLDPEPMDQIKKKYPHLLKKPKPDK